MKHFYSIEVEGGKLKADVEEALAKVESAAAPRISQLEGDDRPVGTERLELALYLALTWLRTPRWRNLQQSLLGQTMTAVWAENVRHDSVDGMREKLGEDAEGLTDDDLEAMRAEAVADLDTGRMGITIPDNNLIKYFLEHAAGMSWLFFALDWTVVRTSRRPFILADTAASVLDPTPPYPGSAAGLLSSPNANFFLPLDPDFGLLAQSNPDVLPRLHELMHEVRAMSDEDRLAAFGPIEGRWGDATIDDRQLRDFNLRTYCSATRFVYGTQQAVCDTHAEAKANPARCVALRPAPPRIHLLEDDPSQPGVMRAWKVVEPDPPPRRPRRS